MTDTTIVQPEPKADYTDKRDGKIKRLWLASVLGALAAVVLVTLTALVLGVITSLVVNLLFDADGSVFDGLGSGAPPFLMGMVGAFFAALFNWYVFYITIPITTLVLRFSLGRFPKRRISRPVPYLRWGVIWGALLVLLPSLFAGYVVSSTSWSPEALSSEVWAPVGSLLGAGLTGLVIGGIAGLGVGGLFLLVVKPARQVLMANPAGEF
ncbi:MAG: hypothetical protein MRY64_05775 [Hyphomonadaceae bacterium]|nr:hypothetical protein [Hyphomonadaceae bacterium]